MKDIDGRSVKAGIAGPGLWSGLPGLPQLAVLAAPYPWVCLDIQHGQWSPDEAYRATLALCTTDVAILIRTDANDAAVIGRALDAGADGVVVPMVNSADEACSVVAACRYPPHGRRSWGPMTGYTSVADSPTPQCLCMIETADALAQVDAIASTPGVTGLFVGPFDLSIALGVSVAELIGESGDHAPLQRVARAARDHGIVVAGFGGAREINDALVAAGFGAVATSTDSNLMRTAAQHDSGEWFQRLPAIGRA